MSLDPPVEQTKCWRGAAIRAALADEAERLVRFMEPAAKSHAVRFAD